MMEQSTRASNVSFNGPGILRIRQKSCKKSKGTKIFVLCSIQCVISVFNTKVQITLIVTLIMSHRWLFHPYNSVFAGCIYF
jgi:hypothetical protein